MEKLFEEIMMGNLPNLVKEIDIQPKEAQRVLRKRNPKRPTPRHKMPKVKYKERLLKAARDKELLKRKHP